MSPIESAPVALIFPPQWTPQNPPFALASLGGHLRSRGIETRLVDLNLDFYEYLLSPDWLRLCGQLARSRREHLKAKCQMRLMLGQQDGELPMDASHLLRLESWLEKDADPWEQAARHILDWVDVLRDPERFFQPEQLLEAMHHIDRALELTAVVYHPMQLALNDFQTPRYALTFEAMEQGTQDSWGNPFLLWMRQRVPQILSQPCSLLAVSLNSFSQVLAGLTLARLLKQMAPEVHLTLGGNFFGRVADRIHRRPEFFSLFCDSLVVGEGEFALEQICGALACGRSVDGIAGVVTAQTLSRPQRGQRKLEEVGGLDLADLPLERYFTPEPVVCIQASRGCYWAQCSFCDSYWGVSLDKKSPERVLAEMTHLNQKYGIRHFEFTDECLPPEDMKILGRTLESSGLDLHWFANARSEKAFVEILPDLPRAGLSMLLWGFESGSERILKLLAKGVHPQQRWKVLEASARAGIWNFAYIFFGFPGETAEEAEQTVDAICNHTDLLHSYGRSVYTLGRHSPMAQNPEAYGLSDLHEGGTDLSVNLTYKNSIGPSPEELSERLRHCTQRCREAYRDPLWMGLRNRENLHLYLVRYGTERVRNWQLEDWNLPRVGFQK